MIVGFDVNVSRMIVDEKNILLGSLLVLNMNDVVQGT